MSTVDSRLDALEKAVSELMKVAKAYSIDKQNYVSRVDKVKPGVGYKIGYNSDGLIISAKQLDAPDIPFLPMEKITNLKKSLDEKADKSSLAEINDRIDNVRKKGAVKYTGSVVNVDENGLVVSVEDLLPVNIPEIPIAKVEGLQKALDDLSHQDLPEYIEHPDVEPGVGCKVSYDNHGHIVSSLPLTADDIPSIFMDSINAITAEIASIRQEIAASNISTEEKLFKKVDKPEQKLITDKYYTKFKVSEDGLVEDPTTLRPEDIPELPKSKITGLETTLNGLATVNQVMELNDEIGHVASELNEHLIDATAAINKKADVEDLGKLRADLNSTNDLVENLARSMPSDQLPVEVAKLADALSALEGRVSVLENASRG